MRGAPLLAAGGFILFALSGCPVTDNYYIDAGHELPAAGATSGAGSSTGAESTGGTDALPQAGGAAMPAGGSSAAGSGGSDAASGGGLTAGTAGTAGVVTAGSADMAGAPAGGAPDIGQAGTGGGASCVPSTERCNGHDDNCNDLVDEMACNSGMGCTGFTLSSDPNHGYMFCSGRKDWAHASNACAAQDMTLASLESAAENSEVAKKLEALTQDPDVTIGANDQAKEGHWVWEGGGQFWTGNQYGNTVANAFAAWVNGSPDNYLDEDCGVIHPTTATWADRACAGTYAYLCEDKTP